MANLVIDPNRRVESRPATEKTKRGGCDRVLAEPSARREQRRMVDLFGTLAWDDGYDYKAERSR